MLWGGKRASSPGDELSPAAKRSRSDDQVKAERESEETKGDCVTQASDSETGTVAQHAKACERIVELDVEEGRQVFREHTVFGFVQNMFPPAPKIKMFLQKDYVVEDVEMLHKGFFAIHLSNAEGASQLLSRIKLEYEGKAMYLFPWTDDFNPNTPSKLLQPVWIKLRNLPLEYRHREALVTIAKGLGKFVQVEAGRVPRICVSVGADDVVDVVHLKTTTCKDPYVQPVEYEDLCFYGVEHANASSCVWFRRGNT